jgi:hypothetical protein
MLGSSELPENPFGQISDHNPVFFLMDLLPAIKAPPWLAIENFERRRPSASLAPHQDESPKLMNFEIAGILAQRFSRGSSTGA